MILNHAKEQLLHLDFRAGDVTFCYTNIGWMVWHWLISSLALGCTVVLYDGSPFYPSASAMWELAEQERCSYMGISARFLEVS